MFMQLQPQMPDTAQCLNCCRISRSVCVGEFRTVDAIDVTPIAGCPRVLWEAKLGLSFCIELKNTR
jgi:hypothetical protein